MDVAVCKARTAKLQEKLTGASLDAAILTDPDSVAYFAGYWSYLGVEFGRPTLLIIPARRDPLIITPLMESDMCGRMSWIKDIRPWRDGSGDEWRGVLRSAFDDGSAKRVGIEGRTIPPLISQPLFALISSAPVDVSPIIGELRMIKSADEVATMREAGQVATAMMEGAKAVAGIGVPEYEVALAVVAAGTRKAASLLDPDRDRFTSPTIHNLQILQSGADTCLVHRRSSTRRLCAGDPVYLCFCGIAQFRNYKLGFDREIFIRSVTDEQARIYDVAVAAQQAALATIRPGVTCDAVNAAAELVYTDSGFASGYRTGRSIGYSYLESPELKRGEMRQLQAGMTFAVDGGITVPGAFGARVGDSIVVTESGFEYLTDYPRGLAVV